MGLPLISQRLYTPSGKQDADSPRNHSLYTEKKKRERETERERERDRKGVTGYKTARGI